MSDPHAETMQKVRLAQTAMRMGHYRKAQEILGPPDPQLVSLVAWMVETIRERQPKHCPHCGGDL